MLWHQIVPGDPLGMDSIIESLDSITNCRNRRHRSENLILDPAIGRWTEEKLIIYDLETLDMDCLKILRNLYWQPSQENLS